MLYYFLMQHTLVNKWLNEEEKPTEGGTPHTSIIYIYILVI